MAISLFPHNQTAYEAALKMLQNTGKAAVIHPTGTGKSFIGFQLCEEFPAIPFRIYLSNAVGKSGGHRSRKTEEYSVFYVCKIDADVRGRDGRDSSSLYHSG